MINVGKSIRLLMIDRNKTPAWLAEKSGLGQPRISQIMNRPRAKSENIDVYAGYFGLKGSEFIAVGESDD